MFCFAGSASECIDLREVVTARLEKPPAAKDKLKTTDGNKVYLCIEMRPLKPNSFSIYYIKREPKHRWRNKQLTLMSPEFDTCRTWVDKIQELLDRPGKKTNDLAAVAVYMQFSVSL